MNALIWYTVIKVENTHCVIVTMAPHQKVANIRFVIIIETQHSTFAVAKRLQQEISQNYAMQK